MNPEVFKDKRVLAALAAAIVFLGVYTGWVDITFLTTLFGCAATPPAQ